MGRASLAALAEALRGQPAWSRKQDLAAVSQSLPWDVELGGREPTRLGDDAAAIADGDGYLLLASELVYPRLVRERPYLAGRVAVLSNVNDIYAMGGRPLALVDTIESTDDAIAQEVLRGLRDGCRRYGLAVVGGHLTCEAEADSVSAAILGRANRLLTSFDAAPGDVILQVVHFTGHREAPYPFWNGSAHLEDAELRADLELLPRLAEAGWCRAARDISMAGLIGSLLMLLELSEVGARLDLEHLQRPDAFADDLLGWLCAVPSYGFVLTVAPEHVARVTETFAERGVHCSRLGEVTARRHVVLERGSESVSLWDFTREGFMGFAASGGKENAA